MCDQKEKIKVIPCSGIGKVFGLMAREAAFYVTEELAPQRTECVCLAHLVTGDKEAVDKINGQDCITIDGCSALCAAKSVAHHGGIVKKQFRSIDQMKKHRGKKPGDGTSLSEDGWMIVEDLADEVNKEIAQNLKEVK